MRANRPKARLTSGFCRLSSAGFTAAFGVVAVLGVVGVLGALAAFDVEAAFGIVAVFGLLAAFGVAPVFGMVAARGCCTDATATGIGVAGFGVAAAINAAGGATLGAARSGSRPLANGESFSTFGVDRRL